MFYRAKYAAALAGLVALGILCSRFIDREALRSTLDGEGSSAPLAPSGTTDIRREVQALEPVPKTRGPVAMLVQDGEDPTPEPGESDPGERPEPSAQERAQLLRLPVISAIRSPELTPAARHDAMREALARSGPSNEPWTRAASATFLRWDSALPAFLGRTVDQRSVRCFAAGCEVDVTFPSEEASEQAATAFRALPDATGGRVQTPPKSENGRVTVRWIWMRPDP